MLCCVCIFLSLSLSVICYLCSNVVFQLVMSCVLCRLCVVCFSEDANNELKNALEK